MPVIVRPEHNELWMAPKVKDASALAPVYEALPGGGNAGVSSKPASEHVEE